MRKKKRVWEGPPHAGQLALQKRFLTRSTRTSKRAFDNCFFLLDQFRNTRTLFVREFIPLLEVDSSIPAHFTAETLPSHHHRCVTGIWCLSLDHTHHWVSRLLRNGACAPKGNSPPPLVLVPVLATQSTSNGQPPSAAQATKQSKSSQQENEQKGSLLRFKPPPLPTCPC